jgi:hypothetical protein
VKESAEMLPPVMNVTSGSLFRERPKLAGMLRIPKYLNPSHAEGFSGVSRTTLRSVLSSGQMLRAWVIWREIFRLM